jgi:hypothetical protein
MPPKPAAAQVGDSVVLLGGGDEVYIAAMPAGWTKQAEVDDAFGHRGDWLPADQTLQDWHDRMTLQVMPQMAGQAPVDFLNGLVALWTNNCELVMASEVEVESVNGYATGSRVIGCTRDKTSGKGSASAYRVVAGERALYVVQRTFRLAPFSAAVFPLSAEDLEAGRAAVGYGLACQRGAATRPCPVDWRPVLAPLDASRQLIVFPAPP